MEGKPSAWTVTKYLCFYKIKSLKSQLEDANEKIEVRDTKIENLKRIIAELKNDNTSKNLGKAK